MKISTDTINRVLSSLRVEGRFSLSVNDESFLMRTYTTDLDSYKNELQRLGFVAHERVLDAGCGFGQWSLALALLNENIWSMDIANERVQFLKSFAAEIGQTNIDVKAGTMANLPYDDSFFDAAFCFGAIFLADWKRAIEEFSRVLRPGGKLFLTANDIGWYMNCWVNQPNRTIDYDPRNVAANALYNTLAYEDGHAKLGEDKIISMAVMREALEQSSFNVEFVRPETWRGKGQYFGLCGVYEVLARRV